MIEVSGSSREIAYTNKQAGVYYTETNADHRSAWQGWRIMSTKMMDDYRIVIDGNELERSDVQKTFVYPHQLKRTYANGIEEIFTLLDSLDAIVVKVQHVKGNRVSIFPLFTESHSKEDYATSFSQQVLLTAKKRHLTRTENENFPVWIGITVTDDLQAEWDSSSSAQTLTYAPAGVKTSGEQSTRTFIIVAGDTQDRTIAIARDVAQHYASFIIERKNRIENVLNRSYIRTNDERFDKALHWAMASMDALIMNQLKKGIFAGLPWFDNYWGRDSFISLPGATLVSGNLVEAQRILRSFAEWQDTVSSSSNYGRIPNLVTTNSISYNTADGTPWFTIALEEYFRYSNDTSFITKMYPIVKRAIEGTLKYHTDDHYFLTHGDAETWMDAVGPDGPWSSRGNRANDIQALWHNQLVIGSRFSQLVHDEVNSNRWNEIAGNVYRNFNKYFVDSAHGLIYDHLNPDDSKDLQLRPNQLFALDLLHDPNVRYSAFKTVTEKLVFPYGVSSLSQEDDNFHPYHHYQPYYVQDAAYHQGIVWTWLAGRWIDYATEYGLSNVSWQITGNMVHQILERGAIGTLSELLDAAERSGEQEPRLSGTYSQAWSLAEFLRSVYQSYLGIRVDATVTKLLLSPYLPSSLTHVTTNVRIEDQEISIQYQKSPDNLKLIITVSSGSRDLGIDVVRPIEYGTPAIYLTSLPANETMTLTISKTGVFQELARTTKELSSTISRKFPHAEVFTGIKLAAPHIRPDLKALKGPSFRLLRNDEIKHTNSSATIIYDAEDPIGDDNGTGTYVYPTTPNLKVGSLDITHFTVSEDERDTYFKLSFHNLSNPGWHPEYGFQLTYVAIAVDKDQRRGSGMQDVGMNSRYVLEKSLAAEDIIYVGGGIRIVDAKGSTLAEYQPAPEDTRNPLGDATSRTISFTIPSDLLGKPSATWRFTVLVGAQDDHGGAGIGEFRSVEGKAKEWIGGGKNNPKDPNVYDTLLPKK